jgi:tetratricopeptide (TPR) repeat protein
VTERLARTIEVVRRTAAVPDAPERVDFGWILLAKGLAEQRSGDHQAALATFQKVLSIHHSEPLREASTRLAIALAYQGLQQPNDARMAFDKAVKLLNDYQPWIESRPADVNYRWQDWLVCQVLKSELEKKGDTKQ